MKYIIQLEDGRVVKRSLLGKGLKPEYSNNALEAEIWMDSNAAVAWCEETGNIASIIPIETLSEVKPVKPTVKKVIPKKAVDM